MKKKLCFVVMGFGKKMDYQNAREVDLDNVYIHIIKPLFEESYPNYELIRADDIAGSDIIDTKMYTLLMTAELVLADITTMNANAIYELGVRHALKPFSTIIMKEKLDKIPFDLNHSRILEYEELGDVLDHIEITALKQKLKAFIDACNNQIDSPLYTYLPELTPPMISEDAYDTILDFVREKDHCISSYVEEATLLVQQSKFKEASFIWSKLKKLLKNNDYIVQQLALSQYKSKYPNETIALETALETIKALNPKTSLDLETLGICGAIYKNLFRLNNNYDYLEEAIEFYKKGFIIKKDYYNGENYSNCLLLKTRKPAIENDERVYLIYESKSVCREILDIMHHDTRNNDIIDWKYATMAVCYFSLGDMTNYLKYKTLFCTNCDTEWQVQTFRQTIEEIQSILYN